MQRQKPYHPQYPGSMPVAPLTESVQPNPPAGNVPFYNPNNFAPPPLANGAWPGPTPPKEPANWGVPAQTGPSDPWDWGEDHTSQQYTQPPGDTHTQQYNPLPSHYDYMNPPQVYQQPPYPVAPSGQYMQEGVPPSHDPWSWGENGEPDSGYYQQPLAQHPVPEPVPARERVAEASVNDAARDLSSLSLQDIPLAPAVPVANHDSRQEVVPPEVHPEDVGVHSSHGWGSFPPQQAIEEPAKSVVLGERSTSVDGAATPISSTFPPQQHLVKAQSEDRSSSTSGTSAQRELPETLEPVELTSPARESTLHGIDSLSTPPQPNVSEQLQRHPLDPPNPVAAERSGFYVGSAPLMAPAPVPAAPPAASPRPQPPSSLLERDNERPDGEGGDEQPAPLNPIFSQSLGPVTSRPASRQAAPHPTADVYPQQPGPPVDLHSPPLGSTGVRTHPAVGSYHHAPSSTASGQLPGNLVPPPPSSQPRQAQEAVGSEFGPPPAAAAAPPTRPPPLAEPLSTGSLPPSSLRMIPGSQTVPQAPPQQSGRPTPAATPVGEQRIVTGYAKNDHPTPAVAPLPQPVSQMTQQMAPADDPRSLPRYAAPPPHRSETIGSENPSVGGNPTFQMPTGTSSVPERLDDRPANEREREAERTRDRERDRDRDYERHRRTSRYHDDDEDERYSMGYRDRRYDDRDYDDQRSNYSERVRDRRRDPRRSDYHGESEYLERSGRRSSLYDPELDEYGRVYPSSRDRDPRRRDYPERSRRDDDRYYSQRERSRHGSTSGADPADRDYRGRDPRYEYRQDPRDPYYRTGAAATTAGYDYYQRNPYDMYRGGYPSYDYNYYYKYNYAAFYEEMKKNPAAYQEWYQRHYGQHHRYPAAVAAPATATASEADRASVHSGRSSVNDEVLKERQAAQLRSSTTGLDQSGLYDWNASVSVFQEETVAQVEETVAPTLQDLTPLKFTSPHVIGRFSAGSLIRVLPNDPKEGAAAYIEVHDLDTLLGDVPSAQELRNFPGPLVAGQTHKQNVIAFCQQKIRKAMENTQMFDRQSYLLIWELLLLLLRQNGTVLGSDISELLLKDIDLHQDTVVQNEAGDPAAEVSVDRALVSFSNEASVINKFRELLLFGNKKEALEWAMRQGLWGHALFLASKMDQRTYSNVMTRFANGLSLTDPLQTLYQLMSGRQPTAVTSCGDEKWGDWRPHLAMIMSNTTQKPELDKRSIVAMGDQLASKGCFLAAQFCYLVAQVDFGTYSSRTSKLVLLTSSASLPFEAFASSEAIQCTELYEYARQLATPEFVIPTLQSYKFLYATRLTDQGRPAEALQYCEAIARTVLKQPSLYSAGLLTQVYQLSSMLKYHDPQYQNPEGPVEELEWLRALEEAVNQKPAAAVKDEPLWVQEQSEQQQQQQYYGQEQQPQQQQYYEEQPASLAAAAPENAETTPSMDYSQDYNNYWAQYNAQYDQYNQQQQQQQQQQWNYEAPPNGGADYSAQEGYNSYNQIPSGYSFGGQEDQYNQPQDSYSPQDQQSLDSTTTSQPAKSEEKPASKDSKGKQQQQQPGAPAGGGWFGGLFNKFSLKPKNQMKLPDDKNPAIVWDPERKRWVNTQGDEDESAGPAAPPKDSELHGKAPAAAAAAPPAIPTPAAAAPSSTPSPMNPTSGAPAPPPSNSGNKYKLQKGRGIRQSYVDVFGGNSKASPANSPPMPELYPSVPAPTAAPTQFFVPPPVTPGSDPGAPADFTTPAGPQSGDNGPAQEAAEATPLMFNPSQFAAPSAATGRGLAGGRRYPR